MSAVSALRAGRKAAERLMVDAVQIARVSTDLDEWGNAAPPAVVYEGKAKVQTFEPYESQRESGGASVIQQRYSVHVPWDAGPFRVGDVVTVTAAALSAHAVGAEYRVAGLHEKSLQTSQRLLVDEDVNRDA